MKITGLNIKTGIVYVDKFSENDQGVYKTRSGQYRLYTFFFGNPDYKGPLPLRVESGSFKLSTRKPSIKCVKAVGNNTYATYTSEEIQQILRARVYVNQTISM